MRAFMIVLALVVTPLAASAAQSRGKPARPAPRHAAAPRAAAPAAAALNSNCSQQQGQHEGQDSCDAVPPPPPAPPPAPPPPPPPPPPPAPGCTAGLAGDVVITGNVSAASVGLSGWCIQLLANGVAVSGAVTDASGNYSLTGASNSAYVVCAVIQPTWLQTYPTPMFAGGVCPSGASGYVMNLPAGGSSPFNDFIFGH